MHKLIVLTLLITLINVNTARADHVYFSNGQVCKGCEVVINDQGYISEIWDKKGKQWWNLNCTNITITKIDKHPYKRKVLKKISQFGQGAAQSYAQQSNDFYNAPITTTNTNCHMVGNQVFCNSTSF